MASKTITRLTDDLDGSTDERTVSFGWDGGQYEIDLSKKNIATFEKALAPYVEAARGIRTPGSGTRRRGAKPTTGAVPAACMACSAARLARRPPRC